MFHVQEQNTNLPPNLDPRSFHIYMNTSNEARKIGLQRLSIFQTLVLEKGMPHRFAAFCTCDFLSMLICKTRHHSIEKDCSIKSISVETVMDTRCSMFQLLLQWSYSVVFLYSRFGILASAIEFGLSGNRKKSTPRQAEDICCYGSISVLI